MNEQKNKYNDNKDEVLDSWPMTMSQSVDIKGNSISSQKDQQDLAETPYFDKIDSLCCPDLFKGQLDFQQSISVKPSMLGQEWSLQPKFQESSANTEKTDYTEEYKHEKEEQQEQITQKREKDELNISTFKPEVLHPTMQRPPIKKHTQIIKEYSVQFKEIKRILNPKKRPMEDSERTFSIREKNDIEIGVSRDCDYIINDHLNSISKKHATLKYDNEKDEWTLIDSSINGSYIIQDEIVLEINMKLIIGTFLCEVSNIQKIDDQTKRVYLLFSNLVDESIHSFSLEFDLKLGGEPFQIGKKYQKEMKEDIIVDNLHCFIQMNFKQEVLLINQNNIYDQVGIKLTSNVPYKLKNESILKFGFLQKYKLSINNTNSVETTFSISYQDIAQKVTETINACQSCTQTEQKLYYLQPCNHKNLCLECIMTKSNYVCPTCNNTFVDFSCSIVN